jgi:hypothetical protein
MNNPPDDLSCTKCLWTGNSDDDHKECPMCGSEIEPIEYEYLPYQKDFNWNKK